MGAIQDWMQKVDFERAHFTQAPSNLFYPQPFYLFRGESKEWDMPVSSSWGREKNPTERREKNYYLRCFKKLFPQSKPFSSDLNLRFIAFLQHYGFKTRLIDVTSSIEAALFFATEDDKYKNENGYVYKLLGYNIDSFSDNLDQADIESVFFNPNFPPSDHPIAKNPIRPYIFYRDNNLFNLNVQRQNGWFVLQTKDYQAHKYSNYSYEITPDEKHKIKDELIKSEYDKNFYFPNIREISKKLR